MHNKLILNAKSNQNKLSKSHQTIAMHKCTQILKTNEGIKALTKKQKFNLSIK